MSIQREKDMNKMLLNTKAEEICCNNKKNDDIKQIKSKIFDKVIDLIHDKQSYMLGPEKTKTAKFIVDNFAELFKILSGFT
ncbi:MAG TPA: hypothetical protein VGB37_11355 [Candidatus Lokiarchaeia archaeon]